MKAIAEFAKTTLVGGLLVLAPIYLSLILAAKALSAVAALLSPVTAQLPAAVQFRELVAIVVVLLASFVAGLAVRTGPGLRAVTTLQERVLQKVPGYTTLRGLAARLSGEDAATSFTPALVEIEDALSPAFIIEELEDGRCTVLVPSVPTPAAGSLFILPRARVHKVDVPFTQLARVISQWGSGTGELARHVVPRS